MYQPLIGLQQPVLVDLHEANLTGAHVLLSCRAPDAADARRLCRHLEPLLESQGASVRQDSADMTDGASEPEPADLRVELATKQVDEPGSSGVAALAYWSLNLLPVSRDSTFVQDLTVRDEQGFLLATRHFEGRLVEHFGVFFWTLTWLLDHLSREPDERMGGDAVNVDLSRDLDSQLCQTLVSAQTRQRAFMQAGGG